MSNRTSRSELDALARIISRECGDDSGSEYAIGYAYGSPRLERAGGSIDVSPRLPAGQLAQWMRAMLTGIYAAQRAGNR